MDKLLIGSEQAALPGAAPLAGCIDQVHQHDAVLKGYLRNAYPSLRDIDDIVQESYLRIWKIRAKETIRSGKDLLFEIARHVAIDLIRRQKRCPIEGVTDLAALDVMDHGPHPAEAACTREELALLADAIASLPARCREIVILRKIKRVPQKEIAQLLGISEQTVQVQVFRGVKRCETFLLKHGLQSSIGHEK